MTQTVAAAIAAKASAAPDEPVFRFLDRGEGDGAVLSYADLDRSGRRLGAALRDRLPEGRALLIFEPGTAFVEALIACLYAGIVAIPAPAPRRGASGERLEAIAHGARARLILTSAALQPTLAQAAATMPPVVALEELDRGVDLPSPPGFDRAPDLPALVQYTSGSTLAPRGVVLTSAGILANIGYACRGVGFGARGPEVVVNWMPHYHDMGLIGNLLLSLVNGWRSVHLPPLAFVQQPARWLRAIERWGGTSSGGPPLAYDQCTARVSDEEIAALDLSSWRIAFCGAEPVFDSTLHAFARRFARARFDPAALVNVYGLAEVAVYAGGSHVREHVEGTPGDPLARTPCRLDAEALETIRIVSATGAPEADGIEGEIWISHPSVAAGYLDDPEATARTFDRVLAGDGEDRRWLATGDLGIRDGAFLTVTGRIKDVLIRNGANVAAADVERLSTDGLPNFNRNGAAAFEGEGLPVPIILLLERERGVEPDTAGEDHAIRAIRGRVFDALGLALDHVEIVDPGTLPRTTSGKVQRSRARNAWIAAQARVQQ